MPVTQWEQEDRQKLGHGVLQGFCPSSHCDDLKKKKKKVTTYEFSTVNVFHVHLQKRDALYEVYKKLL